MPKTAGMPKSLLAQIRKAKVQLAKLERPKPILADLHRLETRMAILEKNNTSILKELKGITFELRKQESMVAQLGKKPARREKRKPSEYNLFLSEKMTAGMSMVDAVKSWKQKEGGTEYSAGYGPGHGPDWVEPEKTTE